MKTVFYILVFLFFTPLLAQQTGSLTVYGKVKYKNSLLNEVSIEVYKDNELQQEMINLKNGSFKLTLALGSVYNISFRRDNYIQKSVAVIAKADSSVNISGRYFFNWILSCLRKREGK